MFAAIQGGGVVKVYATVPNEFNGVERFASLTVLQRAAAGFVPMLDVTSNYDGVYGKITGRPSYAVFVDRVEATYPTADIALAEAKRIKLEQIENRVERVLEAGVLAGGRTWPANAAARNALTSIAVVAVAAGGSLPPSFVWRDSNNVAVSLTLVQMMAVLQAITLTLFNTFENAAQKRDQVAAATTVAQVKAVTT